MFLKNFKLNLNIACSLKQKIKKMNLKFFTTKNSDDKTDAEKDSKDLINKNYSSFNIKDSNKKVGISEDKDNQEAYQSQVKASFKNEFKTKTEMNKQAELLKREIVNNPEFFKAFPHLKDIVISESDYVKGTENFESDFKENYKISEKDKETAVIEKKKNYFESLL